MTKRTWLYVAIAVLIIASGVIIATSGDSILVHWIGVLLTIYFVVLLYREAQRTDAASHR